MEEGESWKRNSHLKRYAELKREKDQLIRKYLSKRGPSAEEMAEGGWVEPDIVECTNDCEGRPDSDPDEEVADEGFEPIPFYYDPVDYVIGLDFDWIEDKQDQLEDILDDDAEDLAEEIAELVEDFVDENEDVLEDLAEDAIEYLEANVQVAEVTPAKKRANVIIEAEPEAASAEDVAWTVVEEGEPEDEPTVYDIDTYITWSGPSEDAAVSYIEENLTQFLDLAESESAERARDDLEDIMEEAAEQIEDSENIEHFAGVSEDLFMTFVEEAASEIKDFYELSYEPAYEDWREEQWAIEEAQW